MAVAGYLPPIVAEVLAEVGKFKAEMAGVKEEMGTLEATQTKLAAAGKVAMMGLAVAVAGVGYESVKLAMNFDQTMEQIHTQAGASQSEVDALKDSVLALAPTVGIGPEKLAEGLYHIESTGMRGQQALDTLAQAAKLAQIGMADLDDVTYAMSGVMSVGMKDVHSAADAISYMNATVGMGDMRMDKLTQAIGTGILPAFKSAGLGMTDFSAALATLADNSVPADEAATRLKMTVALMAAPTKAASDALATIGLSSTQLAEDMRKPNGLLVAVDDLKTHLEKSGMTAVQQNQVIEHAFGGGRTSGAIMTLIEENDRLSSKYDQLGTSAKRAATTDEAWAAQQKQFSQQWHELVATIDVFGVKIGNWLIPKLQEAAQWLMQHKGLVKDLAIAIGGVLVVAIAAWVDSMIAAGIEIVASSWEILLIVAAIAALAYGIYELVTHWSTVWNWIKQIASDVWGWLVGAWHKTIGTLETAAHWVKTKVIDPIAGWFEKYLVKPLVSIALTIAEPFEFAFGFISVILGDFVKGWALAWGVVGNALKWVYDHVLYPVGTWIGKNVLDPIQSTVNTLSRIWGIAWGAIETALKKVWDNTINPIGTFINTYFISPISAAIQGLEVIWDETWNAIGEALQWVYDHTIGPIVKLIKTGINDVASALSGVPVDKFGAGQNAAQMQGYADGGTVPGPIGAPTLAVVHGGEEVLSVDQIRAMGRRPTQIGSSSTSAGGGGGGDVIIPITVMDADGGGKRQALLRYSRRAAIPPTKLFPASTGRLVRSG